LPGWLHSLPLNYCCWASFAELRPVLSPRSIIRSKSLDSVCRSDQRTPPLISQAIIGSSEPLSMQIATEKKERPISFAALLWWNPQLGQSSSERSQPPLEYK
jgi:hypothetical protein